MRHLLALSLCLTFTIQASGDELDARFHSGSEPVADITIAQNAVAVPKGEGGSKGDDAIVWRPRLQIILNTNVNLPMTKTVKERVQVSKLSESGSQPDGSVVYRDIDVRVLAVTLADIATLYSDTITLNVLEDGDTSSYSLECKSRVSIRLNGIDIDAESASLKDGKCELVNAKFTHGKTTATAPQLTLSLPIHGVSTNSFGRPIPETPPVVNLSSPPTPVDGTLRPVPDPISSPKGSDSPRTY